MLSHSSFKGAVATALPASPVRGWIAAGWDRAVELFTGAAEEESVLAPVDNAVAAQTPESAGVRHRSHHVATVAEGKDRNVDAEEITEIGAHGTS